MVDLALRRDLDVEAIAADYRQHGRIRIPGLLAEEGLRALHAELVAREDWLHLINLPGRKLELSRGERAAMSAGQADALDRAVHERACLGFQYRYEGLRVPDPASGEAHGLAAFADLMAGEPMLGFLRTVIGAAPLTFTDAQATAYAPGDFLTCHDDAAPGRDRVAAFVLGMTPRWRPEWGGLLMFHADDDSAADAYVPRFNTLDLFSVPQRHSVSLVTPSAPGRRLALTGWMSLR